ncbi:hypothetical protein [Streptomyces sp. NPDC057002]
MPGAGGVEQVGASAATAGPPLEPLAARSLSQALAVCGVVRP